MPTRRAICNATTARNVKKSNEHPQGDSGVFLFYKNRRKRLTKIYFVCYNKRQKEIKDVKGWGVRV